jgi:amino acid transporter
MILTGSRIYYAVGVEHPRYRWLGRWDHRRGAPARSLWLQAAVTVGLVSALGLSRDGFARLVVFTAPLFWGFLLLAGASLFVLRRIDPQTDRPYRVAGYPLTPALFCASTLFMVYASTRYAWSNRTPEASWTLALIAAGILASLFSGKAHA